MGFRSKLDKKKERPWRRKGQIALGNRLVPPGLPGWLVQVATVVWSWARQVAAEKSTFSYVLIVMFLKCGSGSSSFVLSFIHLFPSAPWLEFSPCFSSHVDKYGLFLVRVRIFWLKPHHRDPNSLPGDGLRAPLSFSKLQDFPQPLPSPKWAVCL